MPKKLFILFLIVTYKGFSQTAIENQKITQKWFVTLNSDEIGEVRTFLNFEFIDSSFVAYTRKNADKAILGSTKAFLFRRLSKKFKNGSLINVKNGVLKKSADTLILSGIFVSAIGNYYFKGIIIHGILDIKLTNGKHEFKGSIKGSTQVPTSPILEYTQLINHAISKTKETIFNTSVLKHKKWKKFSRKIQKVTPKMTDDLEMEFAFFYYASKLPFSHYSLVRLSKTNQADSTRDEAKEISLKELTDETMYMKINSFEGSAKEVDSVFQIIHRKSYKNLIVDLRNNSGGNIEAGMKFAKYVSDSSFYGGVFLSQKWFQNHPSLPEIKDYESLPTFSEANFDLIIAGIHSQEALCLKVIPEKNNYNGKLFILTNTYTASTCEPIVYGLKQQKRATIVGEKTAGAMLNGEFFELESNFQIIVPTADYYTSDGYKIDQKGVVPCIKVDEKTALEYVLQKLIK